MRKAKHNGDVCFSSAELLGDGLDITGRQIEFWGSVWTVECKNYLGDWDVVRREHRDEGVVKITTQVAPEALPETHPKYARLLPKENDSTRKSF